MTLDDDKIRRAWGAGNDEGEGRAVGPSFALPWSHLVGRDLPGGGALVAVTGDTSTDLAVWCDGTGQGWIVANACGPWAVACDLGDLA